MPVATVSRTIFVTGGTGYIGRRLIIRLLERGHTVRALVRAGSESRLPPGASAVRGDALHGISYAGGIAPADTFVHLVGVSHPGPAKEALFRSVDLVSIQAAVPAALTAAVRQFIYLSVAQPAQIMREYVAVRAEGETLIRESGLNATFVRPWYVLGPGHWWPVLLIPGYLIGELIPATRERARRLGLVTITQMVRTLVYAVENPVFGVRILDVPRIRQATIDGERPPLS